VCTGSLDVFNEIRGRIASSANLVFSHPPHNLLQLLLLEGPSSWISNCQELFDKIVKTVDLDRGSMCHGFDGREDPFYRNLNNSL
jgi:hypothetical protein